jgi:protein-S-isoprenylcysteine O-methyltransferase Ste14
MSSGLELTLRIFLPSFFILYVLTGHTFAVASFKKKYGFDPTRVGRHDPVMKLGESSRNAIFAVVFLMTFAYAAQPRLLDYLGPIRVLDVTAVRLVGVIVLVGSLVLVRRSQVDLRDSWRLGLDLAAAPTDLITSGLYARSRNPVYVGMLATCLGLFLVLPNAVTLAIVAVAFVLLQVRIRVEEQYLLNTHGEGYAEYCRRIPRWLFQRAAEVKR